LTFTTTEQNANDRDACGKLWEIYVKEAREYDDELVNGWKGDMDVILVFVRSSRSVSIFSN
jgi:hypothetical protein